MVELVTSESLEEYIDRHTLATLLEKIANVCRDKSEHVQTNWQDEGLAAHWETRAKRLEAIAAGCEV